MRDLLWASSVTNQAENSPCLEAGINGKKLYIREGLTGMGSVNLLRKRWIDWKIVGLSLAIGFSIGLADTFADYVYFYEGSFWDLALFAVPAHEIYMRSLFLAAFLLFGLFGSMMKEGVLVKARLLSTLVDHLPDPVFIKDRESRIILNNQAHRDLLGVSSEEEAFGKSDFDFFPNELAESYREDEKEVIDSGQPLLGREEVVVDPAGRERRLVTNKVPVTERGEVTQLVGINHDVTEKYELQRQVEEMQRLESIGRLTGGIAHEFNNILTAVKGFVSLAMEELPSNSQAYKDLQDAQTAADRAGRITSQLLAFGQRQNLCRKRQNINEIVKSSTDFFGRLIREHTDIVLRLVADDLRDVVVDKAQIEQVILNLLLNARDAMPNGGVLTIETAMRSFPRENEDQRLPLKPGDYVLIRVSDTGIGMSPEIQDKVFEPFFTTKELGEGTGLGLATAYGIVSHHEGEITVSSELGKGTTFRVYLPLD